MKIKNKTIKFISAVLIVSILTPAFLFSAPKQSKAYSAGSAGDGAVAAGVIGALSCKGKAVIGNLLPDSPTKVPVSDSVAQSFICADLAVNTANVAIMTWWDVFEYLIRELIKRIAKQLLAQMTQATINWINSDFHGSPLFLENPKSFFKDIAKHELKTLVDTFGYDRLRFPFGKDFALNAIDSYKRQLEDNAEYTLSKVIKDARTLEFYRNDFDYGGWNGFLVNTQYPQNNYAGFKLLAESQLAEKIQGTIDIPAERVQNLLQQGMGFLSPQTCPSNPSYNNAINEFRKPTFHFDEPFNPPPITDEESKEQRDAFNAYIIDYETRRTAEENEWNKENTCPDGLVNTTPGSVVANQISNALDSPRLMTALDGAIGNNLAAIFDALINHFFEKGLNTIADIIRPDPEPDNWNYYGDFLNDGDVPDPKELKVGKKPGPVSVSVEIGKTESERISGGAKSYRIKLNGIDNKIVSDEKDKTIETVAIVKINVSGNIGNKLEVTGVKKEGSGTFLVEDSSDPIQSVPVTVNGKEVGGLDVSPSEIFLDNDDTKTFTATIFGGKYPYFIEKKPKGKIATASLVDTSLVIVSQGNGTTEVRVADSSSPVKTKIVTIDVGPLLAETQNVVLEVDEVVNVPLSNGKPPYTVVAQQNTDVANAEILPASPEALTITGKMVGTSFARIKDSSKPEKTITINIEVNDNSRIARDARRVSDMKQVQVALELYLDSNNSYPSTGGAWWGLSVNGGSRTTSGANAYIPGLTPTYISVLPADPSGDTSGWSGFLYQSNGTNYKLLSHANGPESFPSSGQAFYDPVRPTWSWMVCSGEPACSSW
jgi:hypothetical protein